MKKIPENWSAIEALEKAAQEKLGDPQARFNADMFQFGERRLFIPISYRKKGRKGDFTEKYFTIQTVANFCPFTGKPLYETSESSNQSNV